MSAAIIHAVRKRGQMRSERQLAKMEEAEAAALRDEVFAEEARRGSQDLAEEWGDMLERAGATSKVTPEQSAEAKEELSVRRTLADYQAEFYAKMHASRGFWAYRPLACVFYEDHRTQMVVRAGAWITRPRSSRRKRTILPRRASRAVLLIP